MRLGLSLKTLFRAPLKTLVTFLLIAAASFAVFSRVADYAVTQREMARATSYYRGVAALDNGVYNTAMVLGRFLPNSAKYHYYQKEVMPPAGLTEEQMNAFSSLPGVSSTHTRYITAGVIDGLKRIVRYDQYIAKYDYTDRFVIEGTIDGYSPGTFGGTDTNIIRLIDCNQLVGGLPVTQGSHLSVIAFVGDGVFLTRGDMRAFFWSK